MGFALKIAGVDKAEIRKRVEEAARILDLSEYLDRKPKALSGGQRQRVAMGRAIVRHPQVFLMDEPLSNLDAKLRVQTRTQIASLQRRLGVTTVYVTHDQVEAMTMGDRVAVLSAGILQQVDTPRRMYDHPNNIFVAGFIGSPAMNLLKTKAVDGGVTLGTGVYPVPREVLAQAKGGNITLGVRPEDLEIADKGIQVVVELVEELGADANVHGTLRSHETDTPIVARVDGRRPPEKGATVNFTPKQGHVHLFDTDTGLRIGD
jgi:multiple sugar transport system ATP-binding protein